MKKLILTTLVFLLAPVICFNSPASFTIKISNVKSKAGQVIVALFSNENDFLKKPILSLNKKADGTDLDFSFPVPEGNYAIAVFHDINNNSMLDKNFVGIPKEPIGFGNNVRPFGKPGFSECAVHFSINSRESEIKLYKIF